MPPERIGSIDDVGVVGRHKWGSIRKREWNDAHSRCFVTNPAIADSCDIFADSLHHRGRSGLFLDDIFKIAVLQDYFFEEAIGAGSCVAAIETYGRLCERVFDFYVLPFCDLDGMFPTSLFGKDSIKLGQGHSRDGIVLIDIHCECIHSNSEYCRRISEGVLKLIELCAFHFSGHWTNMGCSIDEGRRGCARSFSFNLNFHARIVFAKSFGPESHEIVQSIRTNAVELSGDTTGSSIGFE